MGQPQDQSQSTLLRPTSNLEPITIKFYTIGLLLIWSLNFSPLFDVRIIEKIMFYHALKIHPIAYWGGGDSSRFFFFIRSPIPDYDLLIAFIRPFTNLAVQWSPCFIAYYYCLKFQPPSRKFFRM